MHKQSENSFSFEEIFTQNKRRIYYHMHRLNIYDPHEEYFQEGLCALWSAYESYHPNKGPMTTYFNFIIRNRLIDLIRKTNRTANNDATIMIEQQHRFHHGNYRRYTNQTYPIPRFSDTPIVDPYLWDQLEEDLTENQRKWVQLYVIEDLPIREIAIRENTTEEAVKSWGKQTRKKLRHKNFRE